MAFDEGVLLDQDRFLTAELAGHDFQGKMTGTELRYLLGRCCAAEQQRHPVAPGLLATCWRRTVPIFVGALPTDTVSSKRARNCAAA